MARSQNRPTKAALAALCRQKKSHRQIAALLKVSESTVGWWLNQYGLKSVNGSNKHSIRKPKCQQCGTTDPKKFYYGRKSTCTKCWSKQQTKYFAQNRRDRRTTLKYAAVQAKGGCCQKCGYRKNLSALQFHHPDQSLKHENWHMLFRQVTHSSKHMPTLAAQLEHCELLCANCHAEEHNPDTEMPICVSGKMLPHLSRWVVALRHFFHQESADGTR